MHMTCLCCCVCVCLFFPFLTHVLLFLFHKGIIVFVFVFVLVFSFSFKHMCSFSFPQRDYCLFLCLCLCIFFPSLPHVLFFLFHEGIIVRGGNKLFSHALHSSPHCFRTFYHQTDLEYYDIQDLLFIGIVILLPILLQRTYI